MEAVTLVREMGCTLADFARWLPGATNYAPLVTTQSGTEIQHCLKVETGTVEIRLRPLPDRRIAGMTLPVLQVTFVFIDVEAQAQRVFLKTFDDYTRRGGG